MNMMIDGEKLITTVAFNKAKDREEAEKAFTLFCGYYETRVTQMAVVLCEKWKKPEKYAYQIVVCAFEKVWLYPTFDKSKSKIKDTDLAILNWIHGIMIHELTLLSQRGGCSHPEAEDLPLITNPTEFIDKCFEDEYLTEEAYERMRTELERVMTGLSEQEITVYLTYKVYLKNGKTVPRNVLKKLRERYNITQDGIKHCRLRVEEKIRGKGV